MARVYDEGAYFSVSLGHDEIGEFRGRWPASGLGGLRRLRAQFDKDNGDLVDLQCNGRGRCERFDGDALLALIADAQCFAEHKLGIDTGRCDGQTEWRTYLRGSVVRSRSARSETKICHACSGHGMEYYTTENGRRRGIRCRQCDGRGRTR